MAENQKEVLTVAELAEYLRVPRSTLYRLVREGSVPCQKIGKHWRFRRDAIDEWLADSSGCNLVSQNSPNAHIKGDEK